MAKKVKEEVKRTVFDWLKSVTYTKEPWNSFTEDEQGTFNSYILNRFISMHESYLDIVNYVQTLWQLTPEQIYLIYCKYLPKQYVYSKYIKSSKPKANKELLQTLANHFKVSMREVKQYLLILTETEIKAILQSRGMNDEEVNKLMNNETDGKSTKKSKNPK